MELTLYSWLFLFVDLYLYTCKKVKEMGNKIKYKLCNKSIPTINKENIHTTCSVFNFT